MGFLAPAFLLAAAAVALPLWLHRLQVRSAGRQPFSSTMLLEQAEQQVHVRRKLRYLALLALRVALLLLLALVFARPFLPAPATPVAKERPGTVVIVLDTSASMARTGLFERALAIARELVDTQAAGVAMQVLAADQRVRMLGPLSSGRAEQLAAIALGEVTAMRLDFGQAVSAIDRLAEDWPAPVTLHIVSDFQQSAMPVRFADLAMQRVSTLRLHRVGAPVSSNRHIEFVRNTPAGLDAGIVATAGATRVSLYLNGERAGQQTVPGGRTRVSFTELPLDVGDNRIAVVVAGDDQPGLDDRWFGVIVNEPPVPVPLLSADSGGLPFLYLSAALEADAGASWQVIATPLDEFDSRALGRYRLVMVDDLASIDGAVERALLDYLGAGGQLLAFIEATPPGGGPVPITGHQLTSVVGGNGAALTVGRIDASHPALAQTSGWHAVRFAPSSMLVVTPEDEVLVELQNGAPLVIERRVGAGRLLLVNAGLDNRSNDLPVHPVFVGFVMETARYLSADVRVERVFTTGDVLPLALVGGASGQVIDPDGAPVLSLAGTTQAQQIRLEKPGIYEVSTPGGDHLVAVNVDRREFDTDAAAEELLDGWIGAAATPAGHEVAASDAAAAVELWRWLALVLALTVVAESMLANVYLAPRGGAT